MTPRRVLVSWIAVNNDPYERDGKGGSLRLIEGREIMGPTLTLLFDPDSPYKGTVSDLVLFHRHTADGEDGRESRALNETMTALRKLDPLLNIFPKPWHGDDPTDHLQIFKFLKEQLPPVREQFADKELLVHVSPGTPSMQTVLVLMAETGFIDRPFSLVKSYRKDERNGRQAVVPVQLGIESYYKAYRAARPLQTSSEDATVVWDPAKFRSKRMKAIFDEARRFSSLKVPVLLLGERGTGKTTLAGWIRSNSPYRVSGRDDHWPAVACGQYNPETMRAELFGHRRGAFTGADKDHDGLLAQADKDTLFLDEVGDVSRDLQRLLIKAIEEKRYMRLGDSEQRTSNFRLISATNLSDKDLRERLDPDFFDRISMLTLRLPPLREVKEEIPWLWEMVFAQAVSRSGVGDLRLAEGVHRSIVDKLSRHPLPGNLRDLFRVAYRAIAVKADRYGSLLSDDAAEYGLAGLDDSCGDSSATSRSMPQAVARAFAESSSLDALIGPGEVIETKVIERALKAYLADELRRISKRRGVSSGSLCDVTDRALRDWMAADVRRN